MSEIKNIALHHAGGSGNDPYASTRHLTVDGINADHKARWNFPSSLKDPKGTPWYFGYNVIYNPKDRSFTQGRAIGEETAAQFGYNFDTFSICIIGNFMRRPLTNPSAPVDPFTQQTKDDITLFLFDLINGNKRGLKIAPGAKISLDIARVWPHRHYGQTDCYGSFISDTFFRDQLVAYKPVPVPVPVPAAPATELEKRSALSALLLQLIIAISDFLSMLRDAPPVVGAGERSCVGLITGSVKNKK